MSNHEKHETLERKKEISRIDHSFAYFVFFVVPDRAQVTIGRSNRLDTLETDSCFAT